MKHSTFGGEILPHEDKDTGQHRTLCTAALLNRTHTLCPEQPELASVLGGVSYCLRGWWRADGGGKVY
eukprot:3298149-Rhodomonas_salina.2